MEGSVQNFRTFTVYSVTCKLSDPDQCSGEVYWGNEGWRYKKCSEESKLLI